MRKNYRTPAPDLPEEDLDIGFLIEAEIEWRRREAWEKRAAEYRAARCDEKIAFHKYSIGQTLERMRLRNAEGRMVKALRDEENQYRAEHGLPPLPPGKK